VQIDLRTLASDSRQRDQFIKANSLQTDKYPFAEFNSDRVTAAPDGYRAGEEVTFKLPGRLKVHDTELPVVWDVTAKLERDTLTGSATTGFNMTDVNVPIPQRSVLTVENFVKLEMKLVARRA
jgi:polyisoprenoid-binding protein YceI